MVKADGSVSVHSDGKAYKPLNWMTQPCDLRVEPGRWIVTNTKGESLTIVIDEIHLDVTRDLGADPGLQKDGVEAHLQELLAANPGFLLRRPAAGAPRIPDRHRAGRLALPRRRRPGCGGRDQTAR